MNRRRARYLAHTLLGGLLFPLLPVGCSGTEPTETAPSTQAAAPAEEVGSAASAVSSCNVTFAAVVNVPSGNAASQSIAAADLNGDGKIDLVSGSSLSVLLNQGNGTFSAPVSYPPSTTESVAVADLNGDGRPDIVTADSKNGVAVLLDQGNGTFGAPVTYPTNGYALYVATADVNGDGLPDLTVIDEALVGEYFADLVTVLINQGNGTFGPPVSYDPGGFPHAIVSADLNGDGFLDLVVPDFYGGVNVMFNQGDGTFAAPVSYTFSAPGNVAVSDWVSVADVDGDGHPDIVVAGEYSGVTVLLNQGNGTFGAPVSYPAGTRPSSVAVADLNGDGYPDIAVSNYAYGNGGASVLLNQGNGTFGAPVFLSVPASANGSVTLADLNGDGKADLVLSGLNNDVAVFFNTSQCTFTPCTVAPCTALDACHVAGVCNPSSGLCTNPAAPNGTTCSDGHPCTVGDACQSGACVGGPITTAGACSPVTVKIQRAGASGTVFDAAVDVELPTMNNGASASIPVGLAAGAAGKYRATLMSFDLSVIPSGAYIQSAVATLYAYQSSGSEVTRVHQTTAPWSESTVTAATFPNFLPATAATFPGVANLSVTAGTLEPAQADFTALVQAWYSGASPNDGVVLEQNLTAATLSLTGSTAFCSSEWTATNTPADGPTERPALVVTYIPNY